MENLRVLILGQQGLPQDYITTISSVDPRVNVLDGSVQFIEELRRNGAKGTLIERLEAEARIKYGEDLSPTGKNLETMLAEAEILYGTLIFPERLFLRAPKLKWIHIQSVGVDRYVNTELFKTALPITCIKGAPAIPIAESILAYMMMFSKNMFRLLDAKRKKHWDKFSSMELKGQTVGIIGLGSIGLELAKMANALGMKVIATKRTVAENNEKFPGVEELVPLKQLGVLLAKSDFVVLAVPLTPETKHMIGKRELDQIKPGAYLINIARGEAIDEAALIESLKNRRLGGAALDVFEKEPLPETSELWDLGDVIISPHIASWSNRRGERILESFCNNLRRYLAKQPLLNLVDKERGY